jgi:ATP-dependent HslUV protease subunit HslV
MSVIVAVRKAHSIVIAADSQDNFGDLRPPASNHSAIKLRHVGRAILGASGWALYDDLLTDYLEKKPRILMTTRAEIFKFFLRFWKELRSRYSLVNDQCRSDDKSPFADLDAGFLVASPGGIFQVASNLSVSEFKQYFAIGSGGDYALGALHALYETTDDAEEIARRAVAAACAYDSGCGGDVLVHHVKLSSRK